MTRVLAISLMLLVLALPAAAQAQSCAAPPGTAAVEEYCETIPAAGGDREGAAGRPAPVPAGSLRVLARSQEGQDFVRLLGHDPARAKDGGSGQSGKPGATGTPRTPGQPATDPLSAVTSALSSGPTPGGGFVSVLLALTLLMAGWGWIAYRRRTDDPD
jgi:hypothetical protein